MLRLAGAEKVVGASVTSAALVRRCIGSIGNRPRHVWPVAFCAVCGSHVCRVPIVALRALRDLAVDLMAVGTLNCAMFALIFPHLGNLGSVAIHTRAFYFRKGNLKGRMRVLVTADAVSEFEVGLSRLQMTLVTVYVALLDGWRVTDMAAHTRDRPVLSSRSLDFIRGARMTLCTTLAPGPEFRLARRFAGIDKQRRHQNQQYQTRKTDALDRVHLSPFVHKVLSYRFLQLQLPGRGSSTGKYPLSDPPRLCHSCTKQSTCSTVGPCSRSKKNLTE